MSSKPGKGRGSNAPIIRRPLRFWSPFNAWWRAELERTGKRRTSDEISSWYAAQASHAWGSSDRPSLTETRTHAKCLRSTASVRDYFREYRAKKKHEKSDTDEDEEMEQQQEQDDSDDDRRSSKSRSRSTASRGSKGRRGAAKARPAAARSRKSSSAAAAAAAAAHSDASAMMMQSYMQQQPYSSSNEQGLWGSGYLEGAGSGVTTAAGDVAAAAAAAAAGATDGCRDEAATHALSGYDQQRQQQGLVVMSAFQHMADIHPGAMDPFAWVNYQQAAAAAAVAAAPATTAGDRAGLNHKQQQQPACAGQLGDTAAMAAADDVHQEQQARKPQALSLPAGGAAAGAAGAAGRISLSSLLSPGLQQQLASSLAAFEAELPSLSPRCHNPAAAAIRSSGQPSRAEQRQPVPLRIEAGQQQQHPGTTPSGSHLGAAAAGGECVDALAHALHGGGGGGGGGVIPASLLAAVPQPPPALPGCPGHSTVDSILRQLESGLRSPQAAGAGGVAHHRLSISALLDGPSSLMPQGSISAARALSQSLEEHLSSHQRMSLYAMGSGLLLDILADGLDLDAFLGVGGTTATAAAAGAAAGGDAAVGAGGGGGGGAGVDGSCVGAVGGGLGGGAGVADMIAPLAPGSRSSLRWLRSSCRGGYGGRMGRASSAGIDALAEAAAAALAAEPDLLLSGCADAAPAAAGPAQHRKRAREVAPAAVDEEAGQVKRLCGAAAPGYCSALSLAPDAAPNAQQGTAAHRFVLDLTTPRPHVPAAHNTQQPEHLPGPHQQQQADEASLAAAALQGLQRREAAAAAVAVAAELQRRPVVLDLRPEDVGATSENTLASPQHGTAQAALGTQGVHVRCSGPATAASVTGGAAPKAPNGAALPAPAMAHVASMAPAAGDAAKQQGVLPAMHEIERMI